MSEHLPSGNIPMRSSGGRYRSYANALLVNGTVFLPIFGERVSDQRAEEAYRSLGLAVVPIRTEKFTDKAQGSIHCITMGYPQSVRSDQRTFDW